MPTPIVIPPSEYSDSVYENIAVLMAEHQEQYETLPAVRRYPPGEPSSVWTRWKLTDDERRMIVATGCIDITILTGEGGPMQPMIVAVPGIHLAVRRRSGGVGRLRQ